MIPQPLADFLGDVTALQLLLWILAAVVVCTAVVRAWPVVKRGVTLIDVLGDLPESLAAIRRQVENDHPADPNLREELTDVGKTVTKIHDEQSKMHTEQSELRAAVAALSEWQRKHEKKSDAVVARVLKLEEKEDPS